LYKRHQKDISSIPSPLGHDAVISGFEYVGDIQGESRQEQEIVEDEGMHAANADFINNGIEGYEESRQEGQLVGFIPDR
jgi:hypothetical protein